LSDAERLLSIDTKVNELSNRITRIEGAIYDDNGSEGVVSRLKDLWENFWRWHDETWIEFISKERRESCFYIREKAELRNKKQFSMAKFAFITKEVAQAVGTAIILLKLFGIIP
jgi:hypothetical protein